MKAMQKKVCPHCRRELLIRDFYTLKNGTHTSWCKECQRKDKMDRYNRYLKKADGYTYDTTTGRTFVKEGLSRRIYWNPQMLSEIRRLYPTNTNQDVSEYIGVSVRTLIRKARELGLEKDPVWLHKIWEDRRRLAQFESRRKGYPGNFRERPESGVQYRFKKGHQISPKERGKISQSLKDWYRRNPVAAKKKYDNMKRAVRCIETGETWKSVLDASRSVGVSSGYFSFHLNNGLPLRGQKYELVKHKRAENEQPD